MKTLTTIIISIITLVSTANATNTPSTLEITNTAATANNTVVLNWSSKNEANNSRYEIERSFYSNDFTTVATLQVPFATNSSVKNYSINDNGTALSGRAIVYYRVKQINANGTVTYSNTMVVNLKSASTTTNTSNASVAFTAAQNGNATITVKSITGQTVATQNMIISRGNNTVDVNLNGLTKGMYVSEVSVNGVAVATQKLIAE